MRKSFLAACFLLLGLGVVSVAFTEDNNSNKSATAAENQKESKQPTEAAVKRTRETVQMLDDIYKQTIVLITDKYVHEEDDFAAGSAAVELFRRVSKTGFHNVRLIDLTGMPYEPENVAKSDFEKQAVKEIKSGKGYFDKIGTKDGQPYLQAMTAVPVVMKKCVMCHAHFADAKKGEAIGAVSYEIPIK